MEILNIKNGNRQIMIRGALGSPNYYTPERIAALVSRLGEERATKIVDRYNAQKGIYQKRRAFGKTLNVKYAFYPYDTTRTEARGILRDKFQAGMQEWQAMTEEEKEAWAQKKGSRKMTRCNYFLHCYMLDLI